MKPNELMVFEGNEVEVLELNGQALFNPYHVGQCLGMSKSSVKDHLAVMNQNQAVLLTNSKVGLTDLRKFHNTGEKFLTESGVYKLVFKSRKPDAERFTDWVTDKVLPSVMRTGSYNHKPYTPGQATAESVFDFINMGIARGEKLLNSKQK